MTTPLCRGLALTLVVALIPHPEFPVGFLSGTASAYAAQGLMEQQALSPLPLWTNPPAGSAAPEPAWKVRRRHPHDAAIDLFGQPLRYADVAYGTGDSRSDPRYKSAGAVTSPHPALRELLTSHPLRPSYRIVTAFGPFYSPKSDISESRLVQLDRSLADLANKTGNPMNDLIDSLAALESAKRRVSFHDDLENQKIHVYMKDSRFGLQIDPITKTLDLHIHSPEFFVMLNTSEKTTNMICAQGHELGHVAYDNGLVILRPGVQEPPVPARLQTLLPKKLLRMGRSEILADLLTRRLAGETAYQIYMLHHFNGFRMGYENLFEKRDLADVRELIKRNLVDHQQLINMMTYLFVLLESGPRSLDKDDAIGWLITAMGIEARLAGITPADEDTLYHYYRDVLESHTLAEGVLLPETPSGGARGGPIGPWPDWRSHHRSERVSVRHPGAVDLFGQPLRYSDVAFATGEGRQDPRFKNHAVTAPLAMDPNDSRAINAEGMRLLDQGELDQAANLWLYAGRLQPRKSSYWRNLAAVRLRQKNLPAAENAAWFATALAPWDARVVEVQNQVNEAWGRFRMAVLKDEIAEALKWLGHRLLDKSSLSIILSRPLSRSA